jgi:hypothetical protein
LAKCCDDSLCCQGRILVLPHDHKFPASRLQRPCGLPVACPIPCELLAPPCRIRPRNHPVPSAGMPKTPSDFHGNPLACKDNVDLSSERGDGSTVEPIANTVGAQLASNGDFRRGIAPSLRLHSGAYAFGTGEADISRRHGRQAPRSKPRRAIDVAIALVALHSAFLARPSRPSRWDSHLKPCNDKRRLG